MESYIVEASDLISWLDSLRNRYVVIGPVRQKNQTVFEKVSTATELTLDYGSTMLSPREFIYPPRQSIARFGRTRGKVRLEQGEPTPVAKQLIVGVHPCDVHAILVLDKVFLGDYIDEFYQARRNNSVLVALNCTQVCKNGFCLSMGTGPFLQVPINRDLHHAPIKQGFDILLTQLNGKYLVEFGSQRGKRLASRISQYPARRADLKEKQRQEERLKASFTKHIDTTNLVEVLLQNQEHPIWRYVAEDLCLGCTNCTMVCPTCFCYNVEDRTSINLKETVRERYWDSCQELNFAGVHGGNFRASRKARLRQFVTHKLATWVEQFGCFGCVGCGRCMSWCPTGIDLTEIAKEIMKTP